MRSWRPIQWAFWFAWSGGVGALLTLAIDPDNPLWASKAFGIAAVIAAVAEWWNRRGKKLAEKALGVVRNLGHRLTVVPVAAGGRG